MVARHPHIARCRAGASQRRRVTCLGFEARARAAEAVAAADRAVAITVLRRTRTGMGPESTPPTIRTEHYRDSTLVPSLTSILLMAAIVALCIHWTL